jgi:Domain of unknown function (DUF1841)
MLYGNNIQDTRQMFQRSWQKYQKQIVLEPLERQIVSVVLDHPEYHDIINLERIETSSFLDNSSAPYLSNPYMHMGLHLALRDQFTLDNPQGIQAIYKALYEKHQNHHQIEHAFMPALMSHLATAINQHQAFDDISYLKFCQTIEF